jgi:hypothetical protein
MRHVCLTQITQASPKWRYVYITLVMSPVPVVHTCNPSYSGVRDQEVPSYQPGLLKNHTTKKGWWSGSRCRPWVQASVLQNKQIKQNKTKKPCSSSILPNIRSCSTTNQVTRLLFKCYKCLSTIPTFFYTSFLIVWC